MIHFAILIASKYRNGIVDFQLKEPAEGNKVLGKCRGLAGI